ncbi:hypothetical protein Peur_016907 [Populus x canadensis]
MDRCSSQNEISVAQGPAGTLPSGTPQFSVEIANTNSQVPIATIHLNCKEFSSATIVNPEIFKRSTAVDDCLVNDGRALAPGAELSFKYANMHQAITSYTATLRSSLRNATLKPGLSRFDWHLMAD